MMVSIINVQDREKARNNMLLLLKAENGELSGDKEMISMVE